MARNDTLTIKVHRNTNTGRPLHVEMPADHQFEKLLAQRVEKARASGGYFRRTLR